MTYPAGPLEAVMDLATVRAQVRDATQALEARRAALAGGRPVSGLSSLLREYPVATDRDALSLVTSAHASAEGKRRKRLENLAAALTRILSAAATAGPTQQLEQALSVPVPGPDAVPLHQLVDTLARTSSRAERLRLEAASTGVAEVLGALHLRRLETLQSLRPDDKAQAQLAEAFLHATDTMYSDVLAWWLRRETELKPFPHGADAHDVWRALRSLPFDGLAKRDTITAFDGLVETMGLVPRAGKRIRIDDEDRTHRRPGALVAPLDPPSEIWILQRVRGGFEDAFARLEALGEAHHWAGADPDAPAEDRLMGDPMLRASTGGLFASLLLDRGFLRRKLEAEHPDFLRVLALARLLRARERAWAVVTLRELWSVGGHRALSEATESLSRAIGGRATPSLVSLLLPDPLEAWRPLGGLLRGIELHLDVRERFDEDWWRNPRSGAWLSAEWKKGGLDPVIEPALGAAVKFFESRLA